MLLPIKYQSLHWRTTELTPTECANCGQEVYLDWTNQIVQAIQISEYNGYNLIDYTYNGDIKNPIPTTRTPTLVRLVDGSPDDYCYDRSNGDPYWASYSVDLTRRSASIGDIAFNDYLKIEFNYTSNVVFYCTIQLQRNTGQVLNTVYLELPANLGTGSITEYLEVNANFSGYKIFIKFNASTIDDAEFCFSDLSIKNLTTINSNSVRYIDCYGDEESLSYDTQYFQDRIILTAEIYNQPEYNGYLRIQGGINPAESDIFQDASFLYSSWFTPINPETYGDCKLGRLLKVGWTETCMYVENEEQQSIDYEFYLQGYVQRLPRELGERIQFTSSTGSVTTAFDYSFAKSEVIVGVYPIWIHEILEIATTSNTFYLNDQQYIQDASNIYTIVPLNNGTYTGRTEMRVTGSEKIKTLCCCPVEEPDYSPCGDLTITRVCFINPSYLIHYELSGAVNATSIDVQFENLEAIDGSPCSVPANTTHIETAVSTIGTGFVIFSASEWENIFTDNYCEQMDIQYSVRIRTNCGDSNRGEWSEAITVVPSNVGDCI